MTDKQSRVKALEAKFAGATKESLDAVNSALETVRETNRANAIMTAHDDFLSAVSGRYCKAVGEQIGDNQHFIWNPWDAKPNHVGVKLSYIIVVNMASNLTKCLRAPEVNAKGHAEIFETREVVGGVGIRMADITNIFAGTFRDGVIVADNELES